MGEGAQKEGGWDAFHHYLNAWNWQTTGTHPKLTNISVEKHFFAIYLPRSYSVCVLFQNAVSDLCRKHDIPIPDLDKLQVDTERSAHDISENTVSRVYDW